ncbi:HNH endonuclease [Gluconacetobacter diazotrophicus]|uniref:HNH endonuclease n=1 Tax=Gluconacetobacter diazotrophicus TaxID=33996 RepID=UPI0038994C01
MLGIAYPAHRIGFYKEYNRFPNSGFEIHHLCENKICVNPHHLKEVSHQENIDCITTRSAPVRLTNEQVWSIRFEFTNTPHKKIQEIFNIKSPITIINIQKNRSYKHVAYNSYDIRKEQGNK